MAPNIGSKLCDVHGFILIYALSHEFLRVYRYHQEMKILLIALSVFAITPQVKPSLKEITSKLSFAENISQIYQKTLKSDKLSKDKKLDLIFSKNEKLMQKFSKLVLSGATFVRGEIEDPEVLTQLSRMVQLSALKMEASAVDKKFLRVKEEAAMWLTFAADFPYEEASLVGLRIASVIRSLIFDELEKIEKQSGPEFLKDPLYLAWVNGLRSPWPIDRVVLSEARRLLSGNSVKVAEKLSESLQKNAYQTADQILDSLPGGNAAGLEPFRAMWRSKDVEQMKTEINRIQAMRIRFAAVQWQLKNGLAADSSSDLVKSGLLDKAPIDYKTGQPMTLEQAALH
jgi:hypothetical protein